MTREAPYRPEWARDLNLSTVQPGLKVKHNNPELADWSGVVTPLTRGPRKGLFIEHFEDGSVNVRVQWDGIEGFGRPSWVMAEAIRLED